MKRNHNIISFDSYSWKYIKEMLELGKNLKCKYCKKRINKNNVAGVSFSKKVFCDNSFCLIKHINEWEGRISKQKRGGK